MELDSRVRETPKKGLHFGALAARLRAMKTADALCITAGIIIR